MTFKNLFIGVALVFSFVAHAKINVGDKASMFKLQTHEGKTFDLSERRGKWTVLYFFPKADTPGCTKQACAFRDSIKVIRDLGADVFGVSTDDVTSMSAFHKKHALNFVLLSDVNSEVSKLYDTKMPLIGISHRYTFLIDPNLVIRDINKNVDPVTNAKDVAAKIKSLL